VNITPITAIVYGSSIYIYAFITPSNKTTNITEGPEIATPIQHVEKLGQSHIYI
jgi:hypothetical protein